MPRNIRSVLTSIVVTLIVILILLNTPVPSPSLLAFQSPLFQSPLPTPIVPGVGAVQTTNATARTIKIHPPTRAVVKMTDKPVAPSFEQLQMMQNFRRPRFPLLPKGTQGQWANLPPETRFPSALQSGVSQLLADPGTFTLFQNSSLSSTIPSSFKGVVNEPTAANRGSVVFQTGNFYAALSTNSGNTFGFINPYTAFPASYGGLCCDQVVLYDSSRDLMFWLLNYYDNGTQDVIRLAVAQGNNIAAGIWSYYDFVSAVGTNYDFPDMCLSDNNLWVTVDRAPIGSGTFNAFVFKISLDELRGGGALNVATFDSASAGISNVHFRCTQGAKQTLYWASHNSTSQLRFFSWPENSNTVSYSNVDLSPAWNNAVCSCRGPDNRDWCGRFDDGRITGAWVAQGLVGFMWTASQGGSFPYPYVEVIRLNETTRAFVDRPVIRNNSVAYVAPAASPNVRGDLGINLFYGGGTVYPSGLVGIDDDFNGDPATSGWELKALAASTQGPTTNEWGDYVSVRPFAPTGQTWVATTYTMNGCGSASCVEPRFIVFGRERDRGSVICYLSPASCSYVFLPLIMK